MNTINRILIAIIAIVACLSAKAEDIITLADSAYAQEQYSKAIELYNKGIKAHGSSAALYCNLGDAYYRNGDLGKAIVCYERALRIDPSYEDAHQNLEFVRTKCIDKVGESGTFLENTFDSLATLTTSNIWAVVSLSLFLLIAGGICLYFFSANVAIRKIGFFGAIILVLFMLMSIMMAIRSYNISVAKDKAIILSPSTILSTSPREPKDRNEEAMLLHEGTKVTIVDSVGTTSGNTSVKWYEVVVDNTHRAWIKGTDIEMI